MAGYLLRGRSETINSLQDTRIIESTTLARVNYETFSCYQKLIKSACGHALDELLLLCFVYSVSSESKTKKRGGNKSLQYEPPQV